MQQYKTHQALQNKAENMQSMHLRELFRNDAQRFEKYTRQIDGLLFDFSKTHVDDEVLDLLEQLAADAKLSEGIEQFFAGHEINTTEGRPALHMALRASSADYPTETQGDVLPLVKEEERKIAKFVDSVRTGKWQGHTGKPIKTIVNVGIGGSDLGPKLVCQALKSYARQSLNVEFVSSIDANHLYPILTSCDPETTLFIIASKTFGTEETLTNAESCREWLLSSMDNDFSAIAKHFVAVSTNEKRVSAFGIDTRNMFGFWDWVGGRYSVWSAIGLSIALFLGMSRFKEFQSGAEMMDKHFRTAPLRENLPALMGLLGIWNQNYLGYQTHAILPYDEYLRFLPHYLQQLEMESNGKSVDKQGNPVDYDTGSIIWGGQGNNGQHAFYQLLHQGTRKVFHDFFAPVTPTNPLGDHHLKLLSNCFAQSEALMQGKTEDEVRKEMASQGVDADKIDQLAPFRTFEGNRPSHTYLYETLTPKVLGAILASYEHKVFTQGWIWNINSFDQWGVELGKALAVRLQPILRGKESSDALDPSTRGLINHVRQKSHETA